MRLAALAAVMMLAATAAAGPEATWLEPVHDFGAFDESLGTVTCTFRAVNTGDAPLVVLSARANCGCTTPVVDPEPAAPGDTAIVTVGYNAVGRPGRFSKKVLVTTNATPPRAALTIKGTVIGTSNTLRGRYPFEAGRMRLRTNSLGFGQVATTSTAGDYIEACNASADTIRPEVVSTPDYISVVISPATVPPGENFVVSCVFDPTLCPLYDLVTDTVVVADGDRGHIRLDATAIVEEDFSRLSASALERAPRISVSPDMLDAGHLAPAASGASTTTFTIELRNHGKTPLDIRRIYSADQALSFKIKSMTIKPGKSERLTITLDTALLADRDMLNSRIVIISNDPMTPRRTVRLVGTI